MADLERRAGPATHAGRAEQRPGHAPATPSTSRPACRTRSARACSSSNSSSRPTSRSPSSGRTSSRRRRRATLASASTPRSRRWTPRGWDGERLETIVKHTAGRPRRPARGPAGRRLGAVLPRRPAATDKAHVVDLDPSFAVLVVARRRRPPAHRARRRARAAQGRHLRGAVRRRPDRAVRTATVIRCRAAGPGRGRHG